MTPATSRTRSPGACAPELGQTSGHGLWMANQLCDLVQVRAFAGGNIVRLHMRRR